METTSPLSLFSFSLFSLSLSSSHLLLLLWAVESDWHLLLRIEWLVELARRASHSYHGSWGTWSLSQGTWGKRRGTPWTGSQPIIRHNHTHTYTLTHYGQFGYANQPTTHLYGLGRKPEYLEETTEACSFICDSYQPEPGKN
ncbi:hypothetical protein AMELA_G00224800 [Ameiurus melas]|uniref:Uncharacterized protein n=1 Tax=Ameiurus melas TaxID=219545 RepID=A0A7J6A3B0_AMEME|nr:hypothetical protein AMELA_G00224800 [Ameiurus melas]